MNLYQKGNLLSPTSEREYERRWTTVRAAMAEKEIDCILLFANQMRQSGGIRYFLDQPTYDTYGVFAVFPKEGGMGVFAHGAAGKPGVHPEIGKGAAVNLGYPFAPAFPYTWRSFAESILEYLKHRGYKRIGLYRSLLLPYYILDYLRTQLNDAVFIDFDEELDEIKAIKSDEELKILREVVQIHDRVYAAIPALVKPGKSEKILANEIQKLCLDMGCETLNIRIGSGSPKAKAKIYLDQNRIIQAGDALDILVEVSGPGNYFGEIGRMWYLGDPPSSLLDAVSDVIEMQDMFAALAKPGTPASELMEALHRFQEDHGYQKETRIFAHGQGLDLVERPNCAAAEPMLLKKNMFLAVHPGMEDSQRFASNTDNYLITETGAVRVNSFPRQLIII